MAAPGGAVLHVDFPEVPGALLANLNRQRVEGKLCDVSIHVQGRVFRAHRAVLAASSPFFHDQVLLKDMTSIVLPGVMDPGAVETVLGAAYTGRLSMAAADVVNLLTVGSVLQMWHIVDKCTELLREGRAGATTAPAPNSTALSTTAATSTALSSTTSNPSMNSTSTNSMVSNSTALTPTASNSTLLTPTASNSTALTSTASNSSSNSTVLSSASSNSTASNSASSNPTLLTSTSSNPTLLASTSSNPTPLNPTSSNPTPLNPTASTAAAPAFLASLPSSSLSSASSSSSSWRAPSGRAAGDQSPSSSNYFSPREAGEAARGPVAGPPDDDGGGGFRAGKAAPKFLEEDEDEEDEDEDEEGARRPLYAPPRIVPQKQWVYVKQEWLHEDLVLTCEEDEDPVEAAADGGAGPLSISDVRTLRPPQPATQVNYCESSAAEEPAPGRALLPMDMQGNPLLLFPASSSSSPAASEHGAVRLAAAAADGAKIFLCHCGKAFSHRSMRDRHVNMHLNLRPFGCPVCAKKFKMKHHLTEHMKTHTGLKPYECHVCAKKFMWRDSFVRHKGHCERRHRLALPGAAGAGGGTAGGAGAGPKKELAAADGGHWAALGDGGGGGGSPRDDGGFGKM